MGDQTNKPLFREQPTLLTELHECWNNDVAVTVFIMQPPLIALFYRKDGIAWDDSKLSLTAETEPEHDTALLKVSQTIYILLCVKCQ